jgi:excinuclease UvrABC nuclease subunit
MTIGIGAGMLEGFVDVTAILRSGVYALLREGKVVYIGQSRKPLTRIESHRSMWGRRQKAPAWMQAMVKGMLFDEVHVLPCRIEDLDEVERAMIALYRPYYNIKLKPPQMVEVPAAEIINRRPGGITFVRRL